MNELLLDAFRHNAWATRELLTFCRPLGPEQLDATTVGTYGGVRQTIQHILEGEAYYWWRLWGDAPAWWNKGELPAASLPELEAWNEEMSQLWESMLTRPLDPEAWVSDTEEDGSECRATAGVIVAQTLNHGNEHRSQVNTILTTLGLEPPDVQAWAYGVAVGRHIESPAG
jgi:uncharacterized damage-inducible protein DinB